MNLSSCAQTRKAYMPPNQTQDMHSSSPSDAAMTMSSAQFTDVTSHTWQGCMLGQFARKKSDGTIPRTHTDKHQVGILATTTIASLQRHAYSCASV
eukprot:767814-Amphidinium_carterae.1